MLSDHPSSLSLLSLGGGCIIGFSSGGRLKQLRLLISGPPDVFGRMSVK